MTLTSFWDQDIIPLDIYEHFALSIKGICFFRIFWKAGRHKVVDITVCNKTVSDPVWTTLDTILANARISDSRSCNYEDCSHLRLDAVWSGRHHVQKNCIAFIFGQTTIHLTVVSAKIMVSKSKYGVNMYFWIICMCFPKYTLLQ